MSYCNYVASLDGVSKKLHKSYHDKKYGFPEKDDDQLFARLMMEINQAGLSWDTVLRKEDTFKKAYDNFAISKVAKYNKRHVERLLSDPGIIRNKLKVNAAIENAKAICSQR